MTINVGFFNIPRKMLGTMEKFIEHNYVPWLCVLKKRWNLLRFHLQMTCNIYIFTFVALNKLIKKNVWVGIMWILMCHGRISFVVDYWMMLLCTNTFTWLGVVWKTKGKNIFNFIIGMLVLKRCNIKLMNISSMDLIFAKTKFF